MTSPQVNEKLAAEYGMSSEEYAMLCERLGRIPRHAELGVASVMWSEHCSYKSSRIHLGKLPTEGPQVIQGPGENAGVVDIGDGQAVVFKMESHNHPSYIEPYQGAATGVGGICRDVFTMGARPIAIADCLRFGEAAHSRTPYLLSGVVAGIGGYGNSFGVPTVTGDVRFDSSYNGNILVNAFCLGLARADRIFLGTASGVGNAVMYVGAKTGRDGIHGATMASAEFGSDAEEKRPTVQVGDPFMEKLLLEACLELMESDVLIGIQDMGAAGLTSSSVEMASRAGSGIALDLDKVPLRESNMSAYEILLSESQERMLMVVQEGKEQVALDIFNKWDLDAAVIGRVTDSGRVVATRHGELEIDLPADLLAEGLKYDRPQKRPIYLDKVKDVPATVSAATFDLGSVLLRLLANPNIASKRSVFQQYDHEVRHGTVLGPGKGAAAVVRVISGDKHKGVAISAGCNSRWVYLDPVEGARRVVHQAYGNICCVGGRPLAITDCLNFGNPENPEIMWQFAKAVEGLAQGCAELKTPVVSGNVSLYNETEGRAIYPTPMIAMVGLVDDVGQTASAAFKEEGDEIFLIGRLQGDLAGSEYWASELDFVGGSFDDGKDSNPEQWRLCAEFIGTLVKQGRVSSADDIAEGGLLAAIAESCIAGKMGADISSIQESNPAFWFGEGPGRFLITTNDGQHLRDAANEGGISFLYLGRVTGTRELRIPEQTLSFDSLVTAFETPLLPGF